MASVAKILSNLSLIMVGPVHGLGTRCGSLVRSNIRSKSGPSSLNFLDTTTRVVGASRSVRRHHCSRSLIACPCREARSLRWIGPSPPLAASGPSCPFNSPLPAFVHRLYVSTGLSWDARTFLRHYLPAVRVPPHVLILNSTDNSNYC